MVGSKCRDVRRQLHEYVDGETCEAAGVEVLRHIAECDGCRALLAEIRSVKSAITKKAARSPAPPYLAVRVRERLDREAAGPRRAGIWEFLSLRPVQVLVVLLVAAIFYVGVRSDRYAVAREVTQDCFTGHERCENSPLLPQHIFTSDPVLLAAQLSAKMNLPVHVPDLTAAGYQIIEGHDCLVGGRPSAHVYYAKAGNPHRISFFCVPGLADPGVLGMRMETAIEAYVPPADCWQNELAKGMNIALMRTGESQLCVLLGEMAREELESILEKCFGGSGSG